MKKLLVFLFITYHLSLITCSCSAQTVGVLYALVYQNTTAPNDGLIINYDPLSAREKILVDLKATTTGWLPYGNFIQAQNGMLYGLVNYGGLYGGSGSKDGTIIRYNLKTGQDTVVYNFGDTITDAATCYGALIQAYNGTLYGVSYGGGLGYGTLYSFNPVTCKDSVLAVLRKTTTGTGPADGLIQASDTNLYVLTEVSNPGYGTLFRYKINGLFCNGYDTQKVFTFYGTNGNSPRGNILQATNGLLYGLTRYGGASDSGVLFSYNLDSATNCSSLYRGLGQKVLVNFNTSTGGLPQRTLIQATDGNLYGTTETGGTYGYGTLFQYNITTNTLRVMVNFSGIAGSDTGGNSYQGLIQADNGLLYGMTYGGGNASLNKGMVFSYDYVHNIYKDLFDFTGPNGEWPYGDFLEAFTVGDTSYPNRCPNDSAGVAMALPRGGKYPLTYLWSNGATTSSISNLKSGVYTCTVSDARGITWIISDTINPSPTYLSFQVANPCYSGVIDSVSVSISGGTAPFTYLWSPGGQTRDTLYHVPPGTYTCSVTDANGCPAVSSVTIHHADSLKIDTVIVVKPWCPLCTNGEIIVEVSGGIPPGDSGSYYYLWSNGGSYTDTLFNVGVDTFAVCITSPYGCGSICDSSIVVVSGYENLTNLANNVHVYPIPSKGPVSIQWSVVSGQWSAEAYNVLGELVYSQFNIQNPTFKIDLSSQPDGVYMLHLISCKGTVTEKLLIQK